MLPARLHYSRCSCRAPLKLSTPHQQKGNPEKSYITNPSVILEFVDHFATRAHFVSKRIPPSEAVRVRDEVGATGLQLGEKLIKALWVKLDVIKPFLAMYRYGA